MSKELEYYNLYKEHHTNIKRNSAAVLNERRDTEFLRFCELGFPTKKTEEYKYTDVIKPFSIDYGLNINRLYIPYNTENVFRCTVNGIGTHSFLILNDKLVENPLQQILPDGVITGSLRKISETFPELVAQYYGKLSEKKNDGLVAFNGALAQDGFFLYVPDNVIIDKPIQLINVMRSDVDFMANSRNLIILGKNAKAQLLVCDHAVDNVNFFANRVTEVFVDENAVYEHYKLENTHEKNANFCSLFIEQKKSSNVLTNVITLHNGITHNNIEVTLNGENAEILLSGMVTADKNQETNNTTSILHNVPNCRSTELFKYILDENAHCGFSGKIFVAKDAQKTTAFQTNKNILLDENAQMRTRPQLEIYADDVKCSHGATIGQLDEQAMFYMQQRGISKVEARLMLMYAFVSDVLENVRIVPLHDRIKMMVENRLRVGESKVSKCAICF